MSGPFLDTGDKPIFETYHITPEYKAYSLKVKNP